MCALSRADLHVHTTFSDGTLTPEDVLNYYAVYPELHVVAITDHNTLDGALRVREFRDSHPDVFTDLQVIVGEEISSRDGHIVGLFLERWVPPGLSAAETIARIHDQKGLAIAVHPYTHWLPFTDLKGVKGLILSLPFDAVETRNANITECYANYWTEWRAASAGLCQVGSSDGHFQGAIGRCYTLFEGLAAEDLRRAILSKQTRAAGRVYGPITLGRYLWRQWRDGKALVPRRRDYLYESGHGALTVRVSDRSSLHACILHAEGVLDAETMSALKEKLISIPEAGTHVVLVLSGVTRIDSAGVTALISGLRASARYGTRVLLADPSPPVRQVLNTIALDRAFGMFASESAALAALDAAGDKSPR
jgi:anti-anti-sigma factor